MDERKSFFDNLEPKSALLVGLVGGMLCLGTLGFILLGYKAANGGVNCSAGLLSGQASSPVAAASAPSNQDAPAAPPVVTKADKPKVELFVMSYCPFGLQMEKAYLPVMDLLKGKAEMDIKFVSYAMHELKEVEENTRQYCIEKDQNSLYPAYLKCFTASGDFKSCVGSVGVNQSRMNSCVAEANKQFGIMDQYNNKSKWLSGRFPVYPIHEDLNQKYGVQGSPTLIINGSPAEVSRSPESVKQAVCASFTNPPAECQQTLSTAPTSPGFGTAIGANTDASAPGCGV